MGYGAKSQPKQSWYTFFAYAELLEENSNVRLTTRAGELSRQGCHLHRVRPTELGPKEKPSCELLGCDLHARQQTLAMSEPPPARVNTTLKNYISGSMALASAWRRLSGIQLLSSGKPHSRSKGALLPARKSTKVRCINVANYRIRVFSIQSVYRLDSERPQVSSKGEFPLEG
jgi:hypothetical protein